MSVEGEPPGAAAVSRPSLLRAAGRHHSGGARASPAGTGTRVLLK